MLSVSATFAADNAADTVAIDNEITIDEPLAVEDVQAVSEDIGAGSSDKVYINESNINQYIDSSGKINESVTADEFVFTGTFTNLNLTVERSITLTGGSDAYLLNPNIEIYSSNVLLQNFTIVQDKGMNSIFVGSFGNHSSNVTISNMDITFGDDQNGAGAIPIEVIYSDNFLLENSTIFYAGRTNGNYVNNVIRITNSTNASVYKNKIVADMVSVPVNWVEEPPGKGIWVRNALSEAIVFKNSDGAYFDGNDLTIYCVNATGFYDTIYAVDILGDNGTVKNNNIVVNGNSYIYGVILSGKDFIIRGNNITSTADDYANGIDIEGPAEGVIEDNNISVTAVGSAYGIYSGMNSAIVFGTYVGNNISAKAYNVFGMSLGDLWSEAENNYIDLTGNYTTGVAFMGDYIELIDNKIILSSSEMGNETVPESFGVESVGVKVVEGSAFIANNTIATAGKGVSLVGNSTYGSLFGNFINIAGNNDKDAYAIYANGSSEIIIENNTIDYQGNTYGVGINNAIYLNNVPAPRINSNKFDLELVSCYVPWVQIPAGNGTWVSFPVSEGIVFENSDKVTFKDNVVNATYSYVVGDYDTIYVIDFKNSNNSLIDGNEIIAKGNTYIYGIILSGDNFTISENNISSTAAFYANGIDIEGPAIGVVKDNNIDVKAETSAYAIYSGMNGGNVTAEYIGNNITGEAYGMFGFSLGDVESIVANNSVLLKGNYSTGIAYSGHNLTLINNLIVLESSQQGNDSVWEKLGVDARGIVAFNGNVYIINNTIATPGVAVDLITTTYVELTGNFINVVANTDKDAYAIHSVESDSIIVSGNNIDYQGDTRGTGINNAVYIIGTPASIIMDNNFTLDLVSSYVHWVEIPAGNGTWVSFPVSEGIVIENSNDTIFLDNIVEVTCGNVVGDFDTIYVVDFKNSDGAVISSNNITAIGNNYIYGIIVSGNDFTIDSNNITVQSEYYANAIDIEGSATGLVKNNVINAIAETSVYPVYSGMNGQDVCVNYSNNNIRAFGYFVIGMSLGDVESNIAQNEIILIGNYTVGIAYRGSKLTAFNNSIISLATNRGDLGIWDEFGVETAGIKLVKGNSEIVNNTIIAIANYAVDVQDNVALVHDNVLIAKKFIGDASVANAANSEVYNNTPTSVNKTATKVNITGVSGKGIVSGIVTTENGTLIANDEVSYSIDGINGTAKTDREGKFAIPASNGKLDITFLEDSFLLPSNASITLTGFDKQKPTINITLSELAIDKDVNITVFIANATGKVSIIAFGVENVVDLDENSTAVLTIPAIPAGEHDIFVAYSGDDVYDAAHNFTSIFLEDYTTRFANITVSGDLTITATLVNSLGDAIANATIVYTVGNVTNTTLSDENGVFTVVGENGATVTISYNGTNVFNPTEIELILKDLAPARVATSIISEVYTTYAIDYYEGERGNFFNVQLVDENNNPLANKTVKIGFNGVVYTTITNETSWAGLQINLKNAGTYTFAVAFLGDDDYNASFVVQKIIVNKKNTSISASAKSYKASAKTKKYTVTLKTDKGSSIDGKVYMASGKKVTMKINGITYTAKTNSKGQATFSLSITKKGKFQSTIKFAGDNTYASSSKKVTITIN